MNQFDFLKQAENSITLKLFNQDFDIKQRKDSEVLFSNKQILFEQYKMLVDSAYKTEERRNGSNNMFLGINTLLSSFIVRPSQIAMTQLIDIPLLFLLTLLGVFLCKEWLEVTTSYKKLNSINLLLIQHFEKKLPSYIFSLRTEIETNQDKTNTTDKANIVLNKENFLPKTFILFYSVYFITIIIYCISNLYDYFL